MGLRRRQIFCPCARCWRRSPAKLAWLEWPTKDEKSRLATIMESMVWSDSSTERRTSGAQHVTGRRDEPDNPGLAIHPAS